MKNARYHGDNELIVNYEIYACNTIPYCTGSDYSGDSVTLSNYYLIQKMLKRYKGVYDCCGDYGTYSIAYIPSELTRNGREAIQDIVNQLERYPSLDDEYLAEFEFNLINDYIDNEYKYMGIDMPIETIKQVVHQESFAIIETGCKVYIDEDKLKSHLLEEKK